MSDASVRPSDASPAGAPRRTSDEILAQLEEDEILRIITLDAGERELCTCAPDLCPICVDEGGHLPVEPEADADRADRYARGLGAS